MNRHVLKFSQLLRVTTALYAPLFLSAGAAAAEGPKAIENILKGIQLVFDHILDALKSLGVEKVTSVGQPFDPARHEAMMQRSEPNKEDGVVLEEYQSCYLLDKEVLRPAKVIVNKTLGPAPAEKEQSEPSVEANTDISSEPVDETTDIEPENP